MSGTAVHTGADRSRRLLFLLTRISVVLVVGISLFLVWWSLNRVRRLQKESAALTQQTSRLSTEIELMTARLSPDRTQAVYLQASRALGDLFDGGDALAGWRDSIRESAVPLALEAEVVFRGTRTNTVGDHMLTLVDAGVELAPVTEVAATRPTYHRILDFAQRVATQTQRVDILSLQVEGNLQSVTRASADIELWATEREGAIR